MAQLRAITLGTHTALQAQLEQQLAVAHDQAELVCAASMTQLCYSSRALMRCRLRSATQTFFPMFSHTWRQDTLGTKSGNISLTCTVTTYRWDTRSCGISVLCTRMRTIRLQPWYVPYHSHNWMNGRTTPTMQCQTDTAGTGR